MSKGFHRLGSKEPGWSNRAGGLPAPIGNPDPAATVEDRPTRLGYEAPVPAVEFEPGPPKMTRAQATSAGFTGNSCNECGSLQMVRNGTCEKCNSCGATTGCS